MSVAFGSSDPDPQAGVGRRALICGVSGQDGAYLAQLLLARGYEVYGTSRDAQMSSFANLDALDIRDRVELRSVSLTDFRSVIQCLLAVRPDEIYNLSGQSSVGLSFEQPVETFESITIGSLNLLEAVRLSGRKVRVYNACSSECYGDAGAAPLDESSPFRPRSPYAVAKAAAFWHVVSYRDAYGMHATSGILFNHESPLRPERFVTQKVVAGACRIAQGSSETLRLGNLAVTRDWGWAPEYVEAMWRMLQLDSPGDFVIATGEPHTLEEFVAEVFGVVGLDWKEHVEVDESLFRPADVLVNYGNAQKAERVLGWSVRSRMKDVVRMMVDARLHSERGGVTGRVAADLMIR